MKKIKKNGEIIESDDINIISFIKLFFCKYFANFIHACQGIPGRTYH